MYSNNVRRFYNYTMNFVMFEYEKKNINYVLYIYVIFDVLGIYICNYKKLEIIES